jgi:hypothetical protein
MELGQEALYYWSLTRAARRAGGRGVKLAVALDSLLRQAQHPQIVRRLIPSVTTAPTPGSVVPMKRDSPSG